MKHRPYLGEYVKYTSLNVLGMIGLSCYILADTFFVAKGLGTNGLAALNLAIPIYSFVHGCGLMLGMGGATKYSILQSQKHTGASNRVFTGTLCAAATFALMFVMAGLFLSKMITQALGADLAVFAMTNTYLRVILLFSPAFLLNDVLLCFVRNDGNPKLAMMAMLGGSMSNILLDYLFIFPLDMGIFGAVFATGLAPVISILILSLHWLGRKRGFHFMPGAGILKGVLPLLSLGFPSLVTEVSSGIVIIVFNMILLKLQGNVGVAAYGVVANLSLVIIAIYTGIAQGIQPLLSKGYGSGNKEQVKRVLHYGIITVLLLSCVIYTLIFCLDGPIASVFNSEHNRQLQEIAQTGLKLYFTGIWFAGTNIILSGYFTSTDCAKPAHGISLLRGLIVIVPMAFLLSALWGTAGVWLAFPVTELIVAISSFYLYRRLRDRPDRIEA
ncbi:MATE family efflux transporter [Massiliimalia timonensis]|uniref:MATE family efflux transporter n=1 Tax=Massiliimalia timonensis TaxID=1987501 RepID=UPI0018A1013C|nr:MATE family efflux transporter [Massiliimalia timonensis]